MYLEPEVFYRFDPTAAPAPVVVDVSRSGRLYPIDFRSLVPFSALHDNVSMYVEEIWKDAPKHGATMLQALFPNTYIDANRHELDIDPDLIEGEWPVPVQFVSRSGLGLLKTVSRYGKPDGTQESVMVEINKKRFMDVASFKKNEGFDVIRGVAGAVLQAVTRRARGLAGSAACA